ncbi:putative fatty acid synthase beta subunit dehydratase [Rhexocercosporidium sp. MPI-PUGE-AT-0058]|nr:putative fatty acid synthase beta subunit dehydratase [Rhexocercosporidium sp. MPI-PUGE-AT-0058]
MTSTPYSHVSALECGSSSTSESFSVLKKTCSDMGSPMRSRSLKIAIEEGKNTVQCTITLPNSLYATAICLKDEFLSGFCSVDCRRPVHLLSLFLAFVCEGKRKDDDIMEVISHVLNQMKDDFLENGSIHTAVTSLAIPHAAKLEIIRIYLSARSIVGFDMESQASFTPSPFLQAAKASSDIKVYGVFGGQGSDRFYFDDLAQTFKTYQPMVGSLVETLALTLRELSSRDEFSIHFQSGIDPLAWLDNPDSRPSDACLLNAPLSLPLIGLLQLMHYKVTSILMGCGPREMHELLAGVTGHSQGLVVAAVAAAATSWSTFDSLAVKALSILFYIGVRSQASTGIIFGNQSRSEEGKKDSAPTPMLSIRTSEREEVDRVVSEFNKALPKRARLELSLFNDAQNVVATGPPCSLSGLAMVLDSLVAKDSQVRVSFGKRRPGISHRFLPVSVPFHNSCLTEVSTLIQKDCANIEILAGSLLIPVYSTSDGTDLAQYPQITNIVPHLIRLITHETLNWPRAIRFPGATHVVDFGPGGLSGVGSLVSHIKDGSGVRVIMASILDGPSQDIGYQPELFTQYPSRHLSWGQQYAPALVRLAPEKIVVSTKLSRLLGLPHLMVAGMTPTTSSWEFVVAIMKAGYHAELATGGFYDPETLSEAIGHIANHIEKGRGITCNVIYASPRSLAWIMQTLQRLRQVEKLPIEGLSIGAGIPSADIIKGYVDSLQLKHISLKPGSVQGIHDVLQIAKALPDVPIILQWTGGRGGGHHSREDFHQPILQTYADIRRYANIILVAGSGFGGVLDTLPYLTGTWSLERGISPMPFDGILLGSRVMVAKEAKTSTVVKDIIVQTLGLDNTDWERTFAGPSGGIVNVTSEMGEAIHKIATRGVRLWAEFDRDIFSLGKEKRAKKIQQKRQYIITKLNADFQKVWFGQDRSNGEPVDLEDMTYADVLRRLVDLTYVSDERRWVHPSWRTLAHDFSLRIMARLATEPISTLPALESLESPQSALSSLFAVCPEAQDTLMNFEDIRYFIWLCGRKGQKPVPFIPIIDEDFEVWFKKDSLWQSEDIGAVFGQDPGRVCILQGPVAVRHSTVANEPIKQILDSIHNGHAEILLQSKYGEPNKVQPQAFEDWWYLGDDTPRRVAEPNSSGKSNGGLNIQSSQICSLNQWLDALSASKHSQMVAVLFECLSLETKTSGIANPVHQLINNMNQRSPSVAYSIENDASACLFERRKRRGDVRVLRLSPCSHQGGNILLEVFENRSFTGQDVVLKLEFSYDACKAFAPIQELDLGKNARIREFFHQIWFGKPPQSHRSIHEQYISEPYNVTRDAIDAWRRSTETEKKRSSYNSACDKLIAPLDFAIVIGWKALIQPLFAAEIDVDFLRLLHLSNQFTNVQTIREGDILTCESKVWAVINRKSGILVDVRAEIMRDGQPVVKISSQFLFRDGHCDLEHTFERKVEPPTEVVLKTTADVAILISKSWLSLDDSESDLLGKTVIFRVESLSTGLVGGTTHRTETFGSVAIQVPGRGAVDIGTCCWKSASEGTTNPVMGYLSRHGRILEAPQLLKKPILLFSRETMTIKAPEDNEQYAAASGDYNPIHVSSLFAHLARNSGPIVHGMHISTRVRALAEERLCGSDGGLFRRFRCNFTGMVLPGSILEVTFHHVGMLEGRKIVRVEVIDRDTQDTILKGECDVEPGHTVYVFTGQGSQVKGMGMELYTTSAAAREVWDQADAYFLQQYGFNITDIIRNNPKSMKISFQGSHGRRVRSNYMALTYSTVSDDGSSIERPCLPQIDEKAPFYTFKCEKGLLSSTQFTQPALILMERAIFADLAARGLVSPRSMYAGHSLGEFGALISIGGIMSLQSAIESVFYRGMVMHCVVDRVSPDHSDYSMCAVDPSRVSEAFDVKTLGRIVDEIARKTTWLLEIVNYNVAGRQYVCAGDTRALCCLTNVLDTIHEASSLDNMLATTQMECARIPRLSRPPALRRGRATIPLDGIDVPFHSSYLAAAVPAFRAFLRSHIPLVTLDIGKLTGRYVPNLTARPFDVTRACFEDVYQRTRSTVARIVLELWDDLSDDRSGSLALAKLARQLGTTAKP